MSEIHAADASETEASGRIRLEASKRRLSVEE